MTVLMRRDINYVRVNVSSPPVLARRQAVIENNRRLKTIVG